MAIESLFGPTPAQIVLAQQKEAQQEQLLRNQMIAQQGAEFGPFRGLYQAGLRFGDLGAQAFRQGLFPTQVDPRLQEATAVQSVLSKYADQDTSNPLTLEKISKDLFPVAPEAALKALTLARQLSKESKETFRLLTDAEKAVAGLPTTGTYQIGTSGQIRKVEAPDRATAGTETERSLGLLNTIEANLVAGKPVNPEDLRTANFLIQKFEKPSISVGPDGSVVKIDPINIGSAFPNTRRAAFGQVTPLKTPTGAPTTTPTGAPATTGEGSATRLAPGVTMFEGRGKPLSDEQFKGLQGGFNMLQALQTVEANKDLFGLLRGPQARASAAFGIGPDAQRAADTEAALGSIKTNVSSLIKGIPSNFDVQTFFGRIPNLNGLVSLESAEKAEAKLTNLKDETRFLVRSAIAYYKKNKNSIPPEFETIAQGYGIDINSVKESEYTPNLQEAFDKKFNVYTPEQESLIQRTLEANKSKGMDRQTAIRFLKSRNRL